MKSFTAKEFSRCPAKVYEAAREDETVEINHDRFSGKFVMYYVPRDHEIIEEGKFLPFDEVLKAAQLMNDSSIDNNDLYQSPELNKKATD